MKRRYTAAAAMMMVMGLCASASAATTVDKTLDNYTLDGLIVEADAVRNQFVILILSNLTIVLVVTLM